MPTGHLRLRRSQDVTATLRYGQHRAGRLLAVHARARDDHSPARVAVLASRKVGTAVRRNRAKRLLREAVREVPLTSGWDVVLAGRAATPAQGMQSVRAELLDLTTTLGLTGEGDRE